MKRPRRRASSPKRRPAGRNTDKAKKDDRTKKDAAPRAAGRASTGRYPIEIKLDRKHDYWGEPFRWRFSSRALRQALLAVAQQPRGFLQRSCRELAGSEAPLRHVEIFHFQEGEFQLIFRVTMRFADRKSAVVSMALSKQDGRHARIAGEEHRNLRRLHELDSVHVVRTLRGGGVKLVNDRGRELRLYGYCTQWLPKYHELGVNKRMSFFVNEQPFLHFDSITTRALKDKIIEICMGLYDPRRKAAMETPRIAAGDFVITRPQRGKPLRLKLIAARKIISGMTEEEAREMYLSYEADWGGRVFRFR